ncbi:MAG: hypothetical protein ACKOCN_02840, partial [Planctomycetaceae bacterium]
SLANHSSSPFFPDHLPLRRTQPDRLVDRDRLLGIVERAFRERVAHAKDDLALRLMGTNTLEWSIR